jgi:FKBP-type peptidyl-prolyl cis-trans isomerase FklB
VTAYRLPLLLTLALVTAVSAAEDEVELKDNRQRAGYAIGVNIATNLKRQGLDVEPKALAAGLLDTLSGKEAALTDTEMREALEALQTEAAAKAEAAGAKNLADGQAFLKANGAKEGVKTTDSGLQYTVLESGSGMSPKETDTVNVHYHGTLIDGTVFDSSVERGEPATFQVGQVIRGWVEALQLMHVGDKWKLFIPSELAYGERSPSAVIGPNSVLIFQVELLGID